MERDSVAPMRKVYPPFVWRAKIPIPAAPITPDLRQDLLEPSGNTGSSDLQGFHSMFDVQRSMLMNS